MEAGACRAKSNVPSSTFEQRSFTSPSSVSLKALMHWYVPSRTSICPHVTSATRVRPTYSLLKNTRVRENWAILLRKSMNQLARKLISIRNEHFNTSRAYRKDSIIT